MALTDDDITATNTLTVANKLTIQEGNPVNPGDFVPPFAEFISGAANKGYIKGKFGVGTANPVNMLDIAGDVGIGTASLPATLHVMGSAHVTANLTVDGVFQGSIKSSNLASSAVQTVHLQNEAVTLDKIAAGARGIASVEGVSSPGGGIDLVPANSVTISGNNLTKQITIGETHSALRSNPHNTTAAQVGALPIAGGAITGNLGVSVVPAHRLHVMAGDEADNVTYGAVVVALTSASGAATLGISAEAISAGGGPVYGLRTSARGDGPGSKYGIHAAASGEGNKQAGVFAATSNTAANTWVTSGVEAYATSAGTSSAVGVECRADGSGAGERIGIRAAAAGAGGTATGAVFVAQQSATAAELRGISLALTHAGTGTVRGIDLDVMNSGTGGRYGIDCTVSGTGAANRYGIRSQLTTAEAGLAASYGLYSTVSSSNGVAYGLGSTVTNTNGTTYGLTSIATNNEGATTTYGIRCSAGGTSTGAKYGIYSSASGSGGNLYAGYFAGNVHVTGTLSKTSGTFLIDHPLDPRNRVLRHNFVESPEELCIYRGKVQLDANGTGVVKMPGYFVALTKEEDATITLTAIGRKRFLTSYDWNQKFDAFTVFGDPNAAVSYVVMASRDDPAVHKLRKPVEEDKTGEEKGQLLFPDAYPDVKQSTAGQEAELQRMQAEERQHAEERKQRREALQAELRSQARRFQEQSEARDMADARRLEKEARHSGKKPPTK